MQADIGTIGVLSQSGGLSIDILKRGQLRGLKFSGLVTLGNSADLGPCDLLEYLLADPETRVIGLYLEDVADGRRFVELLRQANGAKPVVLLKGGRTGQGQRATASHTGALAGDDRIWMGVARQTGMVLVETLDEFLNALLAFQTLKPKANRPTERVVLFGNGGGTSVLAADCFGFHGFRIEKLDQRAITSLEQLCLPAGSSVTNPIDIPANALRLQNGLMAGKIMDAVYACDPPDAMVIHVNLPVVLDYKQTDILGTIMQAALDLHARHPGQTHLVLVLRSNGELGIEKRRRDYAGRAISAGIPTFGEMNEAAKALSAIRQHERFLQASAEDITC
jgi:acyl-CoA synthetase (NDP forming)